MPGDFRSFRVARNISESTAITSFYLEPADGTALWTVKPGQYLTLKVPTDTGPVFKTYSVSSDPSASASHRCCQCCTGWLGRSAMSASSMPVKMVMCMRCMTRLGLWSRRAVLRFVGTRCTEFQQMQIARSGLPIGHEALLYVYANCC